MEAPDFWDDPEKSQSKMKELKSMKDDVATYAKLKEQYEDIETMIEMGYEENDESLIPEIQQMLDDFESTYDGIRMKTLLSGEYDKCNAILRLNAGAGGTESCDWAAMLFRMYSKWADKKGFTLEVLDSLDGDEAGIKSITFQVKGENAYGYLKSEKGVHRLVRISPFNAAGKMLQRRRASEARSRKLAGEARYVRMCFSLTPWSRITGQMWRPVMRMQCSMAI